MTVTHPRSVSTLRILAATFAVALAATSVASASSQRASTDDDGALAAEGGSQIVIAARKTPNGLDHDFHFAEEDQQVRSAIYENLIALGKTTDENGLIVPSYDPADTRGETGGGWSLLRGRRRTLTVKLREGVMSHAGNELTADDVQYSWDRGWEVNGASAFYAKEILLFEEPDWRVCDRYTWEITTPSPNALTELMMINNDLNVLDSAEVKAHATEEDPWAVKWLASNDAGHGAYTLTEWSPGNRVVLTAFDDYYRERAKTDSIYLPGGP